MTTVAPSMPESLSLALPYSIQVDISSKRTMTGTVADALQHAVPHENWDPSLPGFLTQGEGGFEGYVKVYPYMIMEGSWISTTTRPRPPNRVTSTLPVVSTSDIPHPPGHGSTLSKIGKSTNSLLDRWSD